MTDIRLAFLGLFVACSILWLALARAERRISRLRAELAATQNEVRAFRGWYTAAAAQVDALEAERKQAQRWADGIGLLGVPVDAVIGPGMTLWRN